MKQSSKLEFMLAISLFSMMLISSTTAVESTTQNTSLAGIMQGLLIDTQQITKGIFTDNFEIIEKATNNIAAHPEVPKSTKMKLVNFLGPKMADFKAYDMTVHNAAVNISKAAKGKEMDKVLKEYQQMINACQSCHNHFKTSVQKLLK